jgi:hypothetical protein
MNTRYRRVPFVLGIPILLSLALVTCSDDEPSSTNTNGGAQTTGSDVVRSDQEKTLRHSSGSFIKVQRGSVPLAADSSTGEMLFTIDVGPPANFNVPETPPTNWRVATEIHSMGPEGFIFDLPVKASIPLPEGFNPATEDAVMFDYDRAAQRWESVGGNFSEDFKSIEVDAMHLCVNRILAQVWSGRGSGAIRFACINGYSFKICIESFTLTYPEWEELFETQNRFAWINRLDASTTPANGLQHWRLPQGSYKLSIEVYQHDLSQPSVHPAYLGFFQRDIVIDRPHWDWQRMSNIDYEFAVLFGDLTPFTNPAVLTQGRPSCFAAPTPSVGVGSLNVRLEWNANADLDLWVTDPCDRRIYYAATRDSCQGSLGRLDLDNLCGTMVLGRPENIFWRTSPPRGNYKIQVDYFSQCGQETGPVFYTVRWTMRGTSQSRTGTIAPDSTITVAEFTY